LIIGIDEGLIGVYFVKDLVYGRGWSQEGFLFSFEYGSFGSFDAEAGFLKGLNELLGT
jgi:hypothetical protein